MKKRIFLSICATALASVLLLCACMVGIVYAGSIQMAQQTLKTQSYYIQAGIQAQGLAYLNAVADDNMCITIIAPSGEVLYEDEADAQQMENHLERPEIADAFANGAGESHRGSSTLGKSIVYYAVLMPDGNVLRVAQLTSSVVGTTLQFLPWLVLVMLLVVALAALFANLQTKWMIRPLRNINLDTPLANTAYDELSPLLRQMENQHRRIEEQVQAGKQQEKELALITANMREGLVMLNAKGIVLSINNSAKAMLAVQDENVAGQHILAVHRDLTLEQMVQRTVEGRHEEMVWNQQGRKYRVSANPVRTHGTVQGVVLLLTDETEKMEAETMRREFSANVSHELKTPLTIISGYAELLENGMVKPQDVEDAGRRIHNEAENMLMLVEDIIKLSRLDERDKTFLAQPVDMAEVAQQVCETLQPLARRKNVQLSAKGNKAVVAGVRTILQEVLYNLCENAIKYNRSGGYVKVEVASGPDEVTATVQDNGIGIAAAEQARVFERFYRVDKSHSKQTGGTGLGLSIVKHGVLYHRGSVELQSREGQGTWVTVHLPSHTAPKGEGDT